MANFCFVHQGNPRPLARSRSTRAGRHYDPPSNREAKREIALACRLKMIDFRQPIYKGPIVVSLEFTFRRPPSAPKNRVAHTVRPDLDNLIKLVSDALNGILWFDDKQIVSLIATKSYANGVPPYTKVEVFEHGKD